MQGRSQAIRQVGSLRTKMDLNFLYSFGDFRMAKRSGPFCTFYINGPFLYLLVDLFVHSSGPFCTF